jgi:hypothetical protein
VVFIVFNLPFRDWLVLSVALKRANTLSQDELDYCTGPAKALTVAFDAGNLEKPAIAYLRFMRTVDLNLDRTLVPDRSDPFDLTSLFRRWDAKKTARANTIVPSAVNRSGALRDAVDPATAHPSSSGAATHSFLPSLLSAHTEPPGQGAAAQSCAQIFVATSQAFDWQSASALQGSPSFVRSGFGAPSIHGSWPARA